MLGCAGGGVGSGNIPNLPPKYPRQQKEGPAMDYSKESGLAFPKPKPKKKRKK